MDWPGGFRLEVQPEVVGAGMLGSDVDDEFSLATVWCGFDESALGGEGCCGNCLGFGIGANRDVVIVVGVELEWDDREALVRKSACPVGVAPSVALRGRDLVGDAEGILPSVRDSGFAGGGGFRRQLGGSCIRGARLGRPCAVASSESEAASARIWVAVFMLLGEELDDVAEPPVAFLDQRIVKLVPGSQFLRAPETLDL